MRCDCAVGFGHTEANGTAKSPSHMATTQGFAALEPVDERR
jgi:hypothetical protein